MAPTRCPARPKMSTCAPTPTSAPTSTHTYWDWLLDRVFLAIYGQAVVTRFLAMFEGIPAAAGGGVFHDQPSRRTAQHVGRPSTGRRMCCESCALLSAGLFMGTWLHNESPVGDDWARRVAECHPNTSSRPSADWLAQVQARQQCTAAVERRRFAFALGAACLTLVAGITVVLAAPRVIRAASWTPPSRPSAGSSRRQVSSVRA